MTIDEIISNIASDIQTINNAYKENFREIKTRVTFGTQSFPYSASSFIPNGTSFKKIKSIKITQETDSIPLSCAVAASADINFINIEADLWDINNAVRIEVGIHIDEDPLPAGTDQDGYFWVTAGTFFIKEKKSDDNNKTVSVTAFDAVEFLSDIEMPLLVGNNWTIATAFSEVPFESSVGSIALSEDDLRKLKGFTKREALGYIAGKLGKYAKADADGKVCFGDPMWSNEWYNRNGKEYAINFKFERKAYLNSSTMCVGTKKDHIGSGPYCIDNPLIGANSVSEFNAIAEELTGSGGALPEILIDRDEDGVYEETLFRAGEYDIGEFESKGNMLWVIGQSITFDDAYGNTRRIWVCKNEIDLSSGGLTMTISSQAPPTELTIDEGEYATQQDVNDGVASANGYTDEKIGEYETPNITDTTSESTGRQYEKTYSIVTHSTNYENNINYGEHLCLFVRLAIDEYSDNSDVLHIKLDAPGGLYCYSSTNIDPANNNVFDIYYVFENRVGNTGIGDIHLTIYTDNHGGNSGSFSDINFELINECVYVTDKATGLYKPIHGKFTAAAGLSSNFASSVRIIDNITGALPGHKYGTDHVYASSPGNTDLQTYEGQEFNGIRITLRNATDEMTLNAEDLAKMLEVIKYQRKVIDIPIYNKTNGLLVGGTINSSYVTSDGIGPINQTEYSNVACISGLNLLGVKQLRVVFQRNDGVGTTYNSMGEFTIPLEYPLPNIKHNTIGSDTVYGEWYFSGNMTITARDTNRVTCAMASVWYPTGGSLANCNFTFNKAWTFWDVTVTNVTNLYITNIYACY